ncbi:MAG TPA: hypothetical protein DCF93_03855, partial [Desulfuromonas sp.]|nr:hypothetical protein [Desulfuromonas sp.]
MRFRRLVFLCILASCLSGCIVSGDNIRPVDSWPTADTPQGISFETNFWYLIDGEKGPDALKMHELKKRYEPLQITAAERALGDCRQFSAVVPVHSEQTPYYAEFAFAESYITPGMLSLSEVSKLWGALSLGLIPSVNSWDLELNATFHDRSNGKTVTITKQEEKYFYFGWFAIPFIDKSY